jgi:hypothetical protein
MGKSTAFSSSLLALIFNAATIANMANNASSTPLTNLYISLHTADPTATGNQSTNEATYTGYARVAVARSGSGWTVTNNSVSPAGTISFPACTGGSNTITNFGIGGASSGAGSLYYSGTVTPNISVASGVTPQLTTASTITES